MDTLSAVPRSISPAWRRARRRARRRTDRSPARRKPRAWRRRRQLKVRTRRHSASTLRESRTGAGGDVADRHLPFAERRLAQAGHIAAGPVPGQHRQHRRRQRGPRLSVHDGARTRRKQLHVEAILPPPGVQGADQLRQRARLVRLAPRLRLARVQCCGVGYEQPQGAVCVPRHLDADLRRNRLPVERARHDPYRYGVAGADPFGVHLYPLERGRAAPLVGPDVDVDARDGDRLEGVRQQRHQRGGRRERGAEGGRRSAETRCGTRRGRLPVPQAWPCRPPRRCWAGGDVAASTRGRC